MDKGRKGKKDKEKGKNKEEVAQVVDQKDLLSSLDSYIKEKGDSIKVKEKEKEIIDEESKKLKKAEIEKLSELEKFHSSGNHEEIYKMSKKLVKINLNKIENSYDLEVKTFIYSQKADNAGKESTNRTFIFI